MDAAIQRALSSRGGGDDHHHMPESSTSNGAALTPQDHFYRQISRVEDIVEGLQAEQDHVGTKRVPREFVATVMAVNRIVIVSTGC